MRIFIPIWEIAQRNKIYKLKLQYSTHQYSGESKWGWGGVDCGIPLSLRCRKKRGPERVKQGITISYIKECNLQSIKIKPVTFSLHKIDIYS